jgi:endonuclease YncB( thermonuclease family)
MKYTLIRGTFVIRYANSPNEGPEPDGDTIKFEADNLELIRGLDHTSPPDINSRGGINIRLEAIDALETHFEKKHQEEDGAYKARDELLRLLGFTDVKFFPDKKSKVKSASHDSLPGFVLSNGIDVNGRVIGFVYKDNRVWDADGSNVEADGSTLTVNTAKVDQSVNAALLKDGHVYPAFYGTLPPTLREHLAVKSEAARRDHKGLWPRSTANPDRVANVDSEKTLQGLVIWPKLFRRIVSYFAASNDNFDNFDAWLRKGGPSRDDEIFRLDTSVSARLHDVVTASGSKLQLTIWPEMIVIQPRS